ncbi:MAG: metal-dependent transcriptional regulator [Staphylothermus sp.]|nr:metal-dependent transcriptional regulator [Staphylothermus sp.]
MGWLILVDRRRIWRAEDYLEAIYALVRKGEKPGIRKLARILGIKPSSVIEYLRKLDEQGYLVYKQGGIITLTEKGEELAKKIYERHKIIKEFLIKIGVPPEIAEEDACFIEHGLHDVTIEKLLRLMKEIEK